MRGGMTWQHAGVHGDLDVSVAAGKPAKKDRKYAIPLLIRFPSSLILLPRGNDLVGGFEINILVGGPGGAMSTVTKIPQRVTIPKTSEETFHRGPIQFTVSVVVNPGENVVSVGVTDVHCPPLTPFTRSSKRDASLLTV